jgi:serine/threonine protein kinase
VSEDHKVEIIADPVARIACTKCGQHIDVSGKKPFSEAACPACGKTQAVPMKLGSFLLLAELGRGGMGAVYRAYDQTLSRFVAIKVMQRSLADDKQFAQNFLREARAAAALNHPHVAQIYSCGTEKGQLYIVMELVDGGRLDTMIAGGKTVDETRLLEIAVQVAEGLQAAYDIGMVHGDIKPANILFDKQNRAKVVDFGLARFAKQKHEPGEIWGTPFYIAPEKVRSQPEDHRSDIYSLGATLFHALCGKPPFDGPTAKDVVLLRLKEPAPDVASIRDSLHPITAQAIARMLQMEPSLRYPTYKSLIADLHIALQDARSGTYFPSPKKKASGSKAPAILGALLGLSLLGGIVWGLIVMSNKPEPEPTPPPEPPPVVVDVTPEPEPEPEPEVITPELQPFDDAMQSNLVAAIALWAGDNVAQMEKELDALYDSATGFAPSWLATLQAMPAWSERRADDRNRYLRDVPEAEWDDGAVPDDARHPGYYVQALARLMTGQHEEEALVEETARWPAWAAHVTLFARGIHQALNGRIESAGQAFAEYDQAEPENDAPIWPYAFKPVAAMMLQQITAWNSFEREQREAEPDEALRALNEYRRDAHPMLDAAIEQALEQAQARKAAAEEAERAAREAERQRQIAADRARLEEIREANAPLMEAKDFRTAGLNVRLMQKEIKTEEGRALHAALLESYDRLDKLRLFIIRSINSRPAPARISPELRGNAVRVTSEGLQIDQRGETVTRPWDEVSARLMVVLGDYYLSSDTMMPEREKADMYVSLAVYAYLEGGIRPARTFADRALSLDPSLESKITSLMPNLVEQND